MFGLFFSLILLGLSAIDPIGIAAMPILLVQKRPIKRSFIFLGGSFISLMAMGLLFAQGFGALVLKFELANPWFVASIEAIAGATLLLLALILLWRLKAGKLTVDPPDSMIRRLRLGNWQLFATGALLVAIQSIVDVVFVVAMIRIGQLQLNFMTLIAAVATYALFALVLQASVILLYILTPVNHKTQTLNKVHSFLTNHIYKVLIVVSFLLSGILLLLAAQHYY